MVELVRYFVVTPYYEYVRSLVRFYHNLFVQCCLVYAISLVPHATKLVLSFCFIFWSNQKVGLRTKLK